MNFSGSGRVTPFPGRVGSQNLDPRVTLISVDFSKAFDSVRHYSLVSKLAQFALPDCFYNWVIDYLSSRKHQTKAGNFKSTFRAINASIIQGSGLGPVSYVFTVCDLHALFSSNILLKYADDTYSTSSQFSPHPTGVRSRVAVGQRQ